MPGCKTTVYTGQPLASYGNCTNEVNGEVVYDGTDNEYALLAILQHLNIDAKIICINENDEEVWEETNYHEWK